MADFLGCDIFGITQQCDEVPFWERSGSLRSRKKSTNHEDASDVPAAQAFGGGPAFLDALE